MFRKHKKNQKPRSIRSLDEVKQVRKRRDELANQDLSTDPERRIILDRLNRRVNGYIRKGLIKRKRPEEEFTLEELAIQIATSSPALVHQFPEKYPAEWEGKVPLKVDILKDTKSDVPGFNLEVKNCEFYYVWVNSFGAVAAILPDGNKLGLKPDEFEVLEWHPDYDKLEKSQPQVKHIRPVEYPQYWVTLEERCKQDDGLYHFVVEDQEHTFSAPFCIVRDYENADPEEYIKRITGEAGNYQVASAYLICSSSDGCPTGTECTKVATNISICKPIDVHSNEQVD